MRQATGSWYSESYIVGHQKLKCYFFYGGEYWNDTHSQSILAFKMHFSPRSGLSNIPETYPGPHSVVPDAGSPAPAKGSLLLLPARRGHLQIYTAIHKELLCSIVTFSFSYVT